MAATPGLPPQVTAIWQSVIDFLGEPGQRAVARELRAAERKPGDPEIPQGPNKPRIQEFLYPTLGFGCMGPGGNVARVAALGAGLPDTVPAFSVDRMPLLALERTSPPGAASATIEP